MITLRVTQGKVYRFETFPVWSWSKLAGMRLFCALLLLPTLAHAQATPVEMMRQSLYRLQQSSKLTLHCFGSDLRGTQNISTEVIWAIYVDLEHDDVRMEMLGYEDGKLVQRMAADGTRLWNYDAKLKTYSSREYVSTDGKLETNWRQRLFKPLKLHTTGMSAFTLRTLDDIWGLGLISGTWSPWIPTSVPERRSNFILAKSGTPNENQARYDFEGDDSSGFSLKEVRFQQWKPNGDEERNWTLEVLSGVLPLDTDFRFVPPKGARPIVIGLS